MIVGLLKLLFLLLIFYFGVLRHVSICLYIYIYVQRGAMETHIVTNKSTIHAVPLMLSS